MYNFGISDSTFFETIIYVYAMKNIGNNRFLRWDFKYINLLMLFEFVLISKSYLLIFNLCKISK